MNYTPDITDTTVRTGTIDVGGLNVFYREAGKPGNPKLVLLHGFPASSHQYRNLLPALAPKFHVVAMDYPGFGNSDMPDPTRFAYTFDKTSEVVEGFLNQKGLSRFGLFVQDYGGPVGFRILARHPVRTEATMAHRQPHPPRSQSALPPQLAAVNLHAAGLDVGAAGHSVAVPPRDDPPPVRRFGADTVD